MAISEKITLVTELMTEEEKIYYTYCLYNSYKEYQVYQEIGCSRNGLFPIKRSCIIKFACAFDIEVYKGDTLSDPDDEEKFLNTKDDYKMQI